MTDKRLDVMLIVPSMGQWEADFGASVFGLVANFYANTWPYKERVLQLHSTQGSLLANNRMNALKRAVALNCTHALFIDSDQTFPQHTLRQLLSWAMPIVACNVATKTMPAGPTARLDAKTPLFTTPEDKGIVKVWRVGTGVMLIDVSILERVPMPWFGSRWQEDAQKNVGEDWFFCEQLEAAGVPIYVDQGLSMQIGHMGRFNYDHWAVPTPREVIDEKGIGSRLVDGNHLVIGGGSDPQKGKVHPTRRMGLRSRPHSFKR